MIKLFYKKAPSPEEQLKQDILAGKPVDIVFPQLLSLYKERLYWHIRKMTNNHEDTDDCLQEVFVKVFKNLDKFRGDANLYTWINRIATNETISYLRKKNKKKVVSLVTTVGDGEMALDIPADNPMKAGDEIEALLVKALSTLPDKQREVFELRYYEDLTYKEIAKRLGKSEGGLKASYHLAAKKIEEQLKTL